MFASGQKVIVVFFKTEEEHDVTKYHILKKKAYDMTWKSHILKTLHLLGINCNMGVCTKNLSGRRFKVGLIHALSASLP